MARRFQRYQAALKVTFCKVQLWGAQERALLTWVLSRSMLLAEQLTWHMPPRWRSNIRMEIIFIHAKSRFIGGLSKNWQVKRTQFRIRSTDLTGQHTHTPGTHLNRSLAGNRLKIQMSANLEDAFQWRIEIFTEPNKYS